jgi:hypothetical protein
MISGSAEEGNAPIDTQCQHTLKGRRESIVFDVVLGRSRQQVVVDE